MTPFEYEAECPECGASVPMGAGDDAGIGICPVCGARFRASDEPEEDAPGDDAGAEGDQAAEVWLTAGGAGLALSEAHQMAPSLVCLANEQKVNPLAVGSLLEAFTGLETRESRRRVVTGNGLLADGLGLDTARRLVDALAAQNIDAFALPVDRFPQVAGRVKIVRVHGADEEALAVQVDREGTIKTVSWPRVAAGMCVKAKFGGEVTYEPQDDRTGFHAAPGARAGMAGYATPFTAYKRKTVEPEIEVSLVLRDAAGRAFMMDFRESQVRFAYLGDRVHPGREQNLAELLGDILRWAPHAFFAAGFRAVASGKRMRVTKLVGSMERDNYVRWTIACAAARGLFVPR
jgi:hypothetical protein